MFQAFSISCVDVDAFENKMKTCCSAWFWKMNKHSLIDNDFNWFSCVIIMKKRELKCWLIMNSMFNKCFLNYETYFVCNIEEIKSCQKHRFNEAETATSQDIVKQNENFIIDK